MKKVNKVFLIIYISLLSLEFIGLLIAGILDFSNFDKTIIYLLSIIIFPILFLIPYYIPILFINIGNKYGKREKVNFKTDKDYYRDIIKEHSLIELSYIDNYKIDCKKDLVAVLLSLKLKRKINITKTGIEVINDTVIDLKETEVHILKHIRNNQLYISKSLLKEIVINESLQNKTIRKEKIQDYLKSKIMLVIISTFILYELYKIRENLSEIPYLLISYCNVFIIICLIAFLIGFILSKVKYQSKERKLKIESYIRTDKGNEINRKLEGLKLFLRDFSNLKDKEKEDLVLWEDYLIYSVLFNINKKIIDDIGKYIIVNK